MRNSAFMLGMTGGLMGLCVGLFAYGYTELATNFGNGAGAPRDAGLIQMMSFFSPLLAIAGAGMVKSRALWGGIMLLLSAGAMYWAFGTTVFTLFPMGFCAAAGIIAIAAGRPDVEKSHF